MTKEASVEHKEATVKTKMEMWHKVTVEKNSRAKTSFSFRGWGLDKPLAK